MKRFWGYILCILLCMGFACAFSGAASARADGLEVHFMDVGRNDGILIRCGGEDVFIDAGGYKRGTEAKEYMQSVGVTELKYYIGTHAHDDHIGGAPVILKAFRPAVVLQPHDKVRTIIRDNMRSTTEKDAVYGAEYVTMKAGDQVHVGGATLTCIGPINVRNVNPAWGSENDNSLVLRLTYGEVSILLSGDATSTEYEEIAAVNPGALKADVYKNAHHNQLTREAYYQLIDPDYVIFSTAKDRLPETKYMDMISSSGAKALATSPNHAGNIILRTDGSEITFETQYRTEELRLSSTAVEVYEGKETKIKAYSEPYGRTQMLTFTSSDPSVATVSTTGKITGVRYGTAVIRVTDATGIEAECTVTVLPATMTLRTTEVKVDQHDRESIRWKITPSGSKPVIEWSSQDESIAIVDENGRVTGVYPGSTTVTAALASGQQCVVPVTVEPVKVRSVSLKPSSLTMTLGESRAITAKISPTNATWPEVTWSSADESIVTVAQDGTVYAVGVGKAKITATTREGKSKTATVTVKPVYVKKIHLAAESVEGGLVGGVAGRNQIQLGYAVEPANATIQTVEWSTSNKKIATVDENGLVTGHAAGKVTITCKATDGSGRYERIKITFSENELQRKVIEPVPGELIARASRIRYKSSYLEIQMTYVNQTGLKQNVPEYGVLTLVAPDGEQIPLMPVTGSQTALRTRSTKTYTYKVPLSAHPRLNGLDLTRSDAVIVTQADR